MNKIVKFSSMVLIVVTMIIGLVVLGCPVTTTTTTTTTTTIKGATTTTTTSTTTTTTTIATKQELNSPNADSAWTDTDRSNGVKVANNKITFGLPATLIAAAKLLDPSVKFFRHHGEYWGKAASPKTSDFYYIKGTNTYLMEDITVDIFMDASGDFGAWGNATKYDWGLKICDVNGTQLPDANASGTIPNWAAKDPNDPTKWVIKDSDFGGAQNSTNANIDLSFFVGATTTTVLFSAKDWVVVGQIANPSGDWDSGIQFTKGTGTTNVAYTVDVTVDSTTSLLSRMVIRNAGFKQWDFVWGYNATTHKTGITGLTDVTYDDFGLKHGGMVDATSQTVTIPKLKISPDGHFLICDPTTDALKKYTFTMTVADISKRIEDCSVDLAIQVKP